MSTPTSTNQRPPRAPLIRQPNIGHEPHNPVRDDTKLGLTEDLDRQPDGAPHRVIGLTALFSVLLAMLIGVMFISHSTTSRIAAVVLAVIAVPMLVMILRDKAERERDHLHPSR